MIGESTSGRPLDFFVSHASSDNDWAEWITQQLQDAGYTVELDVWNWAAGMDVIELTQQAMDRAARVLEVWSPAFFRRRWAQMEHRASFAVGQLEPGLVLPVVVRPCPDGEIPRLYRTLIRVDLVDLPAAEARARLLDAVAGPKPPTTPPPFPGAAAGRSYPGRLPPVWRVPNHDPFFVGRESMLERMHARLSAAPGAVALVAEQGEGGTGKTALAVEYAWRHAGEFGLVWWVDAGPAATAEASLLDLAALLEVPVTGGAAAVLPAIFAELGNRTDWLLILDDVDDADALARLRPPPTGRLILTSRDGEIMPAHQRIAVGRFRQDESIRLLRRRCPWLTLRAADRIAAIVDDLPLAVSQAGAFLAQTGMSAGDYVPRLVGHADRALIGAVAREPELTAPESGLTAPEPRLATREPELTAPESGLATREPRLATREPGLAATVAVGLESLAALDPRAADLLDQLALLAPEPAPLTAAIPGAAATPGLVVDDPETTGEMVSLITRLGLANLDGTTIVVHSLVHGLIARGMGEQRRTLALGRALRLLASADPGQPGRADNWPLYATLTPHVHAAVAALADTPGVTEPVRFQQLLDHICHYLRMVGQFTACHRLAEVTYLRRRQAHGPDHPETLRWARHLGVALETLGRAEEARAVLEDTFARHRRLEGADHPETLHSAECLGVALAALGENDAAQRLLLDTLARRRRVLGPDAAETLQSANDVGIILLSLGYHAQARDVLDGAAELRRRILGPDDPETLASAHHLGLALAELGHHHSARHVLDEVTRRRRSVLGPTHPHTLDSAHHLGLVLIALGDHRSARRVLDDVTSRRGRTLGPDHADTLASAHHLGVTLIALGDHEAARRVLDDVLSRRRRVLGQYHPDTLTTEGIRREPWPKSPG